MGDGCSRILQTNFINHAIIILPGDFNTADPLNVFTDIILVFGKMPTYAVSGRL